MQLDADVPLTLVVIDNHPLLNCFAYVSATISVLEGLFVRGTLLHSCKVTYEVRLGLLRTLYSNLQLKFSLIFLVVVYVVDFC